MIYLYYMCTCTMYMYMLGEPTKKTLIAPLPPSHFLIRKFYFFILIAVLPPLHVTARGHILHICSYVLYI